MSRQSILRNHARHACRCCCTSITSRSLQQTAGQRQRQQQEWEEGAAEDGGADINVPLPSYGACSRVQDFGVTATTTSGKNSSTESLIHSIPSNTSNTCNQNNNMTFGSSSNTGSVVPLDGLKKSVRILFTVCIFLGYMAFGIGNSLTGPALLDISSLVNASFEAVSYGLVFRSIGNGSGGILIGYLYRHVNRQIGSIVCLIGCGIALSSIPLNRNLYSYIATEGLFGFLTGGIDCASNAWVMELWPGHTGPSMQGLHFFYSLGMVIAPLIDAPFLAPYNETVDPMFENGTISDDDGGLVVVPVTKSQIQIPYAIGGASFFVAAVFAIGLRCFHKYNAPEQISTLSEEEEEEMKDNLSVSYTRQSIGSLKVGNYQLPLRHQVIVMPLAMSLFICYAAAEMNLLTFLSEFVVFSDLRLTKETGAFMVSVLAASFTVFRGASSLIAAAISTNAMIYASVTLVAIGNILIIFWANHSVTAMWIVIVILGLGHSSVNACLYSFVEERIDMSPLICGCCMFSACIGQIVSPIVVGGLIRLHPSIFPLINVGGLSIVVLLLAIFMLLDRWIGKKDQGSRQRLVSDS